MNEYRFRTKSLGVNLHYVQDKYTWCRLSLGSNLCMNDYRFRTQSLGIDLLNKKHIRNKIK